ncbi:MAG TPA: DUF4340 domain-containing protein [Prosthecobacter sp.]|nr:DUF4340 domain-containing protein [Prosthecobacter sp.]HRK13285.1 DUF4340 domain-containing protein [Prosthecobacter sp.]
MNPRSTLLLFLLAAALGAVILGVEKYLPSTLELREMKRGPVKFDTRLVTAIEIESGGDGISLALRDGRWRVRRPFDDLADPERVLKLLAEIPAIGWIQRVRQDEFDGDGWAKTSLDKPRHHIRLLAGEREILDLAVGAVSPVEGAHYLSVRQPGRTDGTASYVSRTTLPDLLKTKPEDWRDAKLLRLAAAKVISLKLGQNGGQIELARAGDQRPWALVKPLRARVGKEKVDGLLSTLLNLEITGVLDAPPAPAGEDTAGSSLKITASTSGPPEEVFEITLTRPGEDAAQTRAVCGHRGFVFTVRSDTLKDLWSQPNDLRDRMLARIDGQNVSAIRIESLLFPEVGLEKKDGSWYLSRHQKWEPANGERVLRFFEALNTHDILEFTADSAANLVPYGLDKPFLKVRWTESGAEHSLLFGKDAEGAAFFAKHGDEPSIYRIEASLLPSIPQDSIKWKGLGALRFSQFALRRITLAAGSAPPTVLDYDPSTAQWTGQRAGRDITGMIDRVKADTLAGKLAKFTVQDWSADITAAIHALRQPAVQVRVTLGEPGVSTGPTRETLLKFAPTQEGMDTALWFGQVDNGPDVFYITRTALMDLLAPVFKPE